MIDVFLSASVPLPERDRRYFETADVLSIREAVKSLVEVVLPIGRITFGGHPAITPLISFFVREASLPRDRLTIFQSRFFEETLPEANSEFFDVRMIDAVAEDRTLSLLAMRRAMIGSRPFRAAVLIGGMEGVVEEAALVTQINPTIEILPIATTGAAAKEVYFQGGFAPELETELTYSTLFRRRFAPSSLG